MSMMQNPRHGSKWYCNKCHTWCVDQVQKCSLCGTKRPSLQPPAKPSPNNEKK